MARRRSPDDGHGFLRAIRLERDQVASFDVYPFSIPAIRQLAELALDPKVTFFVGDNGAGKSTLIEALAVACGFNAEGGTKNFDFATRRSESELHAFIRVVKGIRRPMAGFFLRAESFYNVATEMENLGVQYGDISMHAQSHGESFLALARDGFRDNGLYLLDEPEAALSPQRLLSLLAIIHRLVETTGSQFVIATHSPILMAYPGARIYQLDAAGIAPIAYEVTEHFRITRDFLNHRQSYFANLFAPPGGEPEADS